MSRKAAGLRVATIFWEVSDAVNCQCMQLFRMSGDALARVICELFYVHNRDEYDVGFILFI